MRFGAVRRAGNLNAASVAGAANHTEGGAVHKIAAGLAMLLARQFLSCFRIQILCFGGNLLPDPLRAAIVRSLEQSHSLIGKAGARRMPRQFRRP